MALFVLRFTRHFSILFIALCISLFSSCTFTQEEYIYKFESQLEYFIGKKVRDVVNKYGQPTKYINTADILDQQSGTYMIYDYTSKGMDCQIIFKFSKQKLEIIDWDYSGSCPSYYGSLYW